MSSYAHLLECSSYNIHCCKKYTETITYRLQWIFCEHFEFYGKRPHIPKGKGWFGGISEMFTWININKRPKGHEHGEPFLGILYFYFQCICCTSIEVVPDYPISFFHERRTIQIGNMFDSRIEFAWLYLSHTRGYRMISQSLGLIAHT